MSDLSVNSLQKIKNNGSKTDKTTKFSTLKKQYSSFKKKSGKTDFANSPVLLEQELTMLAKMKEAAEKEGLKDELSSIKNREQAIFTQLANKSFSTLPNVYYAPVSFKGGKTTSALITPEKYIEQVSSRLENIELDDKSKELAVIMLDNSYSPESTSFILKKSLDDDGILSQSKFDAIEMLAKNNISSSIMPQILDFASPSMQDLDDKGMNLGLCQNVCDLKQAGLDDLACFKFAQFLEGGFQNPEKVKKHIVQMTGRDFGVPSVIDILNALKVYDATTKTYSINSGSVQTVLKCKKALNVTRDNERKEINNPIRQLGVSKIKLGTTTMIMKDGKISYVSVDENDTVQSLQEKYNASLSEAENNILLEFVKKYKNSDGEIDSKYARILALLRNNGIASSELLNIIDACIKDDGSMDTAKINNIGILKKAGALSEDILPLLSCCNNDNDVLNAATLSSSVIDANTVSQLLPLIGDRSDVVDFFVDFSPVFLNKEYLLNMADLISLSPENQDENAMNVAYKLTTILFNSDKKITDKEFCSTAENIINISKNPNETTVSDEADGIISVMASKGYSLDEIVSFLEKVKDSNGKFDEKLSDIVWYMTVQDASLSQIDEALNCCKDKDEIDYSMADAVVILLENKVPIEQILKTISE